MLKWITAIKEYFNPTIFEIHGSVLPHFPKWDVDNKQLWRILNHDNGLIKAVGGEPDVAYDDGLFKCTHQIMKRTDSEGYPTHSPVIFTITLNKEKINEYRN